MQKITIVLLTSLFLLHLNAFSQKRLYSLINNSNFEWVIDTVGTDINFYYEKGSYAERNKASLKARVRYYMKSVNDFIGVESYHKPIHYFILEDRQRMKLLVGSETNGMADPENNFVTAIFSEKIKAVSNHELFHAVATNVWGNSEAWINEGMAVYSDNNWRGYDLHKLSKFLIDSNKFISIERIAKKIREYDSMITYPLLGSFAKFVDETYGRETVKLIWTRGRKKMKKNTGRSLDDLEQEWLRMLKTIVYKDIEYLK